MFSMVLLVSGVLDFLVARQLSGHRSKGWLAVGIAYNLLTLIVFKYFNFFIDNAYAVAEAIGLGFPSYMEIALPLGISFFTFQKISYLVDVHRRDSPPARTLVDYLLFVYLFPQLIAGPIVRYKDLGSQIIDRTANENWAFRLGGFYRFIIGLSKKVLIADALDPLVRAAFEGTEVGAMGSWLALLAYAMQIYFDFSGYSDMAIGLGRMIGFRFPENFNWPYLARGFRDFWHRWHITLSTWMRDYLYIPLGGNRLGAARTWTNLWLVFLLSGLWHGASWNFVIWGAWHGLFIVVDRFTGVFRKTPPFVSTPVTFLLVLLGWVWFRAETLGDALLYFQHLMDFEPSFSLTVSLRQWFILALATVCAVAPRLWHQRLMTIYRSDNSAMDILKTLGTVILLILCLGQMGISDGQPFIYFRF